MKKKTEEVRGIQWIRMQKLGGGGLDFADDVGLPIDTREHMQAKD